MSPAAPAEHRGTRMMLCAACFVVVVAGLKAGASFILPILVALFLTLLCMPPMRRLEKLGLPTGVAIGVVITGATLIVLAFTAVIGQSINQFQIELPTYRARLDSIATDGLAWLQAHGANVQPDELAGKLNTGAIMQLVGNTAKGLLSAFSDLFLILLTMIFMLLEAAYFEGKLRAAKQDPQADLSEFSLISDRINKYMAIKTAVSLGTGAAVTLLTAILGVDFPLLWGLIAFLFNFVPNIGSIIAAIPAILLALIQFGPQRAGLVAIGYVVINLVVGNAIEPRLMGARLGLSTLVVFLSLLFWGWIWGPLGMLLSVPLTVIVKILLEHSDEFRWISILLGPGEDSFAEASAKLDSIPNTVVRRDE